jgi:hypothetical protein
MFGHHNLYREGVPARSVVISVLEGTEASKYLQKVVYDVVATVEFGDGTTGQHTERLWHDKVGACVVGDVLPVRYDKQHRDKIVFDLPELEANRYSPKERADGQPRDPGSVFGRTVRRGDVRNLLGELAADPQAFANHIRQLAEQSGSKMVVISSTSTSTGPGPVQQFEAEADTGFPVVDLGKDNVEDF